MTGDHHRGRRVRPWHGLAALLLAGLLLHLTGYNYGFPFVEEGDEARIFTSAFLLARGAALEQGTDMVGYPPLIITLNQLVQPIAEAGTGRLVLRDMWVTIGYLRLLMVLVNAATGALLAWTAWRLAGYRAALLALAAWLVLPGVLQHTIVALTEAWQIFFYTLAMALAVLALEQRRPWAALLSVLAGFGAMAAKYSAAPALGFGVGAVLWLLWQGERRTWGRVLLAQVALLLAGGLYFASNVLTLSGSGHGEAQTFMERLRSLALFDPAGWWRVQQALAGLLALAPALMMALVVAGSLLWLRPRRWQGAAWALTLGIAGVHLALVVGYILFWDIVGRYAAPVMGLVLLLLALTMTAGADWLARRAGRPWLARALPLAGGVVWLLPALGHSLALVTERTLPDTRAALAEWSLDVLTTEYNLILAETVPIGRVFSRDRGGYRGLWQHFFDDDLSRQPLEFWRQQGFQYAIGTPAYFAAARARQPQLADQLLLLKQFPRPGDTGRWRGPTLQFYRLFPPQTRLDVTLGEVIRLAGYDLTRTPDALTVVPYWQALRLPPANYNVYLHLARPDGRDFIAQADGIPAYNRLTRTWYDPAETLIGTTFTVPLPPAAAGEYRLLLGLYDVVTGARLLTATGADFVELARVTLD